MKIADFSLTELAVLAASKSGVRLDIGPFAIRLKSKQKSFLATFRDLYHDFPALSGDALVDFCIELKPPSNYRHWLRPQIIINLDGDEPFQPFAASHAMPLFEWGLNLCIAKQGQQNLMLHAAVLEKNGFALVLPAIPGSGKSTLCSALAQGGWRFLSDEFCIIRPSDNQILPIPRPTPLKNESISVIKNFAPQAFIGPLFPNTRKGTIGHLRAPSDSVAQLKKTANPAWIIFPRFEAESKLRVDLINKSYAFMKLATNSFNYQVQGEIGFKMISHIIDNCACYNLVYSDLNEAIAQIDQLTSNGK
jgi:HprK-related kinase A